MMISVSQRVENGIQAFEQDANPPHDWLLRINTKNLRPN
jgi:hypothetical protein